jgi:xanthine dehydrogenase YagS FAD-binding subunit
LIALGGKVRTTKRTIDVEELFQVDVMKTTALDHDEIVTEILVRAPVENAKSAFLKFAPRKTIDFATVNCAVMITTTAGEVSAARICLNAVSVNPYRATGAEEAIVGKVVDAGTAEEAGAAAVAAAKAMSHNLYKVQIARVLVRRAILECIE